MYFLFDMTIPPDVVLLFSYIRGPFVYCLFYWIGSTAAGPLFPAGGYLELDDPLLEHLPGQQLVVGLQGLVKGEVIGDEILDIQLAGAHPLHHLGMGRALLPLPGASAGRSPASCSRPC